MGLTFPPPPFAEIYARGPISCSLNAQPLHTYQVGCAQRESNPPSEACIRAECVMTDACFPQGGVYDDDDAEKHTNHLVSIVGWGVEPTDDGQGRPYWIGRNSW